MRTVYLDGDRSQRRIGGLITSLVTPFRNDGIDHQALRAHVEWQILYGVDGLAVCSLAGEGPVLTAMERQTVIATCVEAAEGKVPVIAATGSNCTATTIEATRLARDAGADAALITVPYYSKPTQKGIATHFERIAAACDMPIIVDNRPFHTGIDLAPATIEQLGRIRSVIGIADSRADGSRAFHWAQLLPDGVGLYANSDATALAFTLAGGSGSFSEAANVAPRLTAALQHAAAAGNLSAATCLQRRLQPLWHALARDGTAAALKAALSLEARAVRSDVRLPLVGIELSTETAIREALEGIGVETIGTCLSSPHLEPSGLAL